MFKKLRKLFKGKDAKVILENFISLSALQLVGMILPLITLPFVLRVLGFENYGIIVFAASLIAYFQSVTDYSFKITAVRDVAVFKGSQKKLNLIYSKVIIIKGIFLIFSLLVISLIVYSYSPFYEYKLIYGLTMFSLVGHTLFPEWFFQGIEKMRYITYLNLGIKIFFTLCIFIFIKSEEDFWIYPLLQSAGLIGAGLVGQLILIYKYKLKLIWLPIRIIKQTIKTNFPIFVNQFVPTLYNNTSTFLLGLFGAKSMVGIYQAILTIVNIGVSIIEILSRVFFPFLNRKRDIFDGYRKLMLGVVSILIICILAGHKLVFWYLNITYDNAFWVLFVLTIGLAGYVLYNIYGLNYFIVHRQDKLVMKNTIITSIIGFVIAFPLVYFFGIIGTAINLSFSRWMMGGGLYFKYKKSIHNDNSHT